MRNRYLNFDLLLDRSGDQYQARVLKSPAGEAVARFELPFTAVELENRVLHLSRPARATRRAHASTTDLAKDFGRALYEAVFQDDVLRCLSASQALARQSGAGLRLRLRLGEDESLNSVPWEFLRSPGTNEVFAMSSDTPLVRYLDVDGVASPIPMPVPLRILLMVSDATTLAPLQVEEEEARLRLALEGLVEQGRVTITRLPNATLNGLRRELARQEYHIFHFIGHGDLNDAGEGVLYLSDERGQSVAVKGETLGHLMRGRSLRLAVVNACLGASATGHNLFAGTAQSLVQIGLPAVIAMQFEISDGAAVEFAQSFYEAIAHQNGVDIAVVEGRKALLATEEWATPVIFLRSDDGHIFTEASAPASPLPPEVVVPVPPAESPGPPPSAVRRPAAQTRPGLSLSTQEMAELETLTAQAKLQLGATHPKVVLLYRRHAEPDATLVRLLETHLSAAGYDVFLDRHLVVGTRWAEEVNRKIREADAIIPLLSGQSVQSDMLEYEIQTAYQAAQEQNGTPRLLPVRVAYEQPLPPGLASILDSIQYILWNDSTASVSLILALLLGLQATPPPLDPDGLEMPGGAVPQDSPFYVVRPVDHEFASALKRHDATILVKGARQMGKTSLVARGMEIARKQGAQVAFTDFQMLGAKHLASPEALLRTMAGMLANELNASGSRSIPSPRDIWDEYLPAQSNMTDFLAKQVLQGSSQPFVWFMDEVDRLFVCDFAGEIFGMLRSWHNRHGVHPEPWKRLTLVISYATEAHLFIKDMNQSPFNVGTKLQMDDFTLEQVADLNRRYHAPLRSNEEVARFYRLVNGQPYLVRRGLNEMVQHDVDIATLDRMADKDEGVFGDHLRRIFIALTSDSDLTEVVRQVLRGKPCPNEQSFFRLRAAGLISGDSYRQVQMRCRLYADYLSSHLL